MTNRIAENAARVLNRREPAVFLTVVRAPAGSGLRPGQKSFLFPGSGLSAPLGAGELERAIVTDALGALQRAEPELKYYALDGSASQRRIRDSIGVYLEPLAPRDRLIIVGAGHVAVAVCRIAKLVGFEVTVIDDRSDFASPERFPEADRVVAKDMVAALAEEEIDSTTYVVLVTRAHTFDEKALHRLLFTPARYIGMIGSRRRVLVVYKNLAAEGYPAEQLSRVYAPIGLDFGSRTVEEIALAIVAELIKVKRGGRAPSLRLDQWERHVAAEAKKPAGASPTMARSQGR